MSSSYWMDLEFSMFPSFLSLLNAPFLFCFHFDVCYFMFFSVVIWELNWSAHGTSTSVAARTHQVKQLIRFIVSLRTMNMCACMRVRVQRHYHIIWIHPHTDSSIFMCIHMAHIVHRIHRKKCQWICRNIRRFRPKIVDCNWCQKVRKKQKNCREFHNFINLKCLFSYNLCAYFFFYSIVICPFCYWLLITHFINRNMIEFYTGLNIHWAETFWLFQSINIDGQWLFSFEFRWNIIAFSENCGKKMGKEI